MELSPNPTPKPCVRIRQRTISFVSLIWPPALSLNAAGHQREERNLDGYPKVHMGLTSILVTENPFKLVTSILEFDFPLLMTSHRSQRSINLLSSATLNINSRMKAL